MYQSTILLHLRLIMINLKVKRRHIIIAYERYRENN